MTPVSFDTATSLPPTLCAPAPLRGEGLPAKALNSEKRTWNSVVVLAVEKSDVAKVQRPHPAVKFGVPAGQFQAGEAETPAQPCGKLIRIARVEVLEFVQSESTLPHPPPHRLDVCPGAEARTPEGSVVSPMSAHASPKIIAVNEQPVRLVSSGPLALLF